MVLYYYFIIEYISVLFYGYLVVKSKDDFFFQCFVLCQELEYTVVHSQNRKLKSSFKINPRNFMQLNSIFFKILKQNKKTKMKRFNCFAF